MSKRIFLSAGAGLLLLAVVVALLSNTILSSSAHSNANAQANDDNGRGKITIGQIDRLSVVGNTAFLVNNKKQTISVDPNPYGLALVPGAAKGGLLHEKDLVVTDIGGNDTGNTLAFLPKQKGPTKLFNEVQSPDTKGPAMLAFNTQTGSLWVANMMANNVQVFNNQGAVTAKITDPMFNKPWGVAFNNGTKNPQSGSVGAFFISNAGTATIDRVDIIPGNAGTPTFKVSQIGQFTKGGEKTKIAMTWVPQWKSKGQIFKDVLIALDPANNRVAAFPNSSTMTNTMPQGQTVFQGKPLMKPSGVTVNPLNGDLIISNLQKNALDEINPSTGKFVAERIVDNVPVDAATDNGSALFGVVAVKDEHNNLVVYYTDDNSNTVNKLSA